MDVKQLTAVLAVAKHGKFRVAAKHLGMTQSSLSKMIERLEDELGTTLFKRDKTGALLNAAGRQFKKYAEKIVKDAADAKGALSAWRGTERGSLFVGHSPVHRELVAAAVAELSREVDGLRVMVEEAISAQIEMQVRQGELDLGIVHAHALQPEGFCREKLTEGALRLAVHPAHPLAGENALAALDVLAKERFVFTRDGLRSRRIVDEYLEGHSFDPKVAVEASAMVTVLAIVRASPELVTVLPMPLPQAARSQGLAFVDLPQPSQTETTFLIWTGSGKEPRSEAARAFRTALFKLHDHGGTESL